MLRASRARLVELGARGFDDVDLFHRRLVIAALISASNSASAWSSAVFSAFRSGRAFWKISSSRALFGRQSGSCLNALVLPPLEALASGGREQEQHGRTEAETAPNEFRIHGR